MSYLYLLRHAASAPGSSGDDYDRPLSEAGRRQAERMAEHVRDSGIVPATVLCSAAARARQTWSVLAPAMPGAGEAVVEPRLYLASAERLLSRLRELRDGVDSVLLIAHNPGLQHLAALLASEPNAGPAARPAVVMPPCALAVLELRAARWHTLGPGEARLTALLTPRDLGV